MQRSSETIGTIAGALAKAQAELTNPEKSLVATIEFEGSEQGKERSFRYAPLSSGLEIVRKTLTQHEIATVQTTALDHVAGIINLTTVLAHSSGEWIASDWPVCAISETATPHRMGAALTYARRYALFTLVGIAGEDDLDAPDLTAPGPATPTQKTLRGSSGHTRSNKRHKNSAPGNQSSSLANPVLKGQLSAVLRDQLINQLKEIESSENAAIWARRILPAKDTLTSEDARHLEDAFKAQLSALDNGAEPKAAAHSSPERRSRRSRIKPADETIDKSKLAHPEPRRIRDREHVRFVIKQPCLICGRTPSDAHHLRFAQYRALSRKVSDEFTVPLCRGHHREVHRCGNEGGWWHKANIDAAAAARALWLTTHPLPTASGAENIEASSEPAAHPPSRGHFLVAGPLNDETNPIHPPACR
jgi:ERF superfamily protein